MADSYLTVEEVGERIRESLYNVRKLCRSGMLKAEKSGDGHKTNPWRIKESSLSEFLAERAAKSTPQAR